MKNSEINKRLAAFHDLNDINLEKKLEDAKKIKDRQESLLNEIDGINELIYDNFIDDTILGLNPISLN